MLDSNATRARQERLELMRAEFAEQVRRFSESVRLYNQVLTGRAWPRRGAAQPDRKAPPRAQSALPGVGVGLTRRQMQIAELIAKGYTNNQIADALVVTPGTVANHVQHILDRLGQRSRTQVAVWYSKHGRRTASDT